MSERKGTCPRCGNPVAVKNGRKGMFVGCSKYPICKFRSSVEAWYKLAKQEPEVWKTIQNGTFVYQEDV